MQGSDQAVAKILHNRRYEGAAMTNKISDGHLTNCCTKSTLIEFYHGDII